MKTVLAYFGIGLVALIVLAWGIGALLEREHRSSRSARIPRAPEEVFALIDDHENAARWRTGLSQVEVIDETRFIERSGGDALPMRVVERRPPERRVVAIDDPNLGFGGTWTFTLERDGDGTRLTVTEQGFVNPAIMRLFARLLMDPAAAQVQYLRDVGKHFGVAVEIEESIASDE